MKTNYFTFGQSHIHRVNSITWDCDCVCKITAEDPRQVMFDTFGAKWCMQHDKEPDMGYYPRGVIELHV